MTTRTIRITKYQGKLLCLGWEEKSRFFLLRKFVFVFLTRSTSLCEEFNSLYLIFLPGGTEQDCDNFGPEPTLRQRRVEESGSDIDSQHPRYEERERKQPDHLY